MPPTKKTTKKAEKPATKKVATKKTCAKKTAKKAPAKAKKTTKIIAKFNAGWGNQIFIRGVGGGMSWDCGIPMQCIGEDEWLWEQSIPSGEITFKFLINDIAWSIGEDIVLSAGDTIICHPTF